MTNEIKLQQGTVAELIAELEKIEDKNCNVQVRNCDGYDVASEVYITMDGTVYIES